MSEYDASAPIDDAWSADMSVDVDFSVGSEMEALDGRFDRRPLDKESRELVWVAPTPS